LLELKAESIVVLPFSFECVYWPREKAASRNTLLSSGIDQTPENSPDSGFDHQKKDGVILDFWQVRIVATNQRILLF